MNNLYGFFSILISTSIFSNPIFAASDDLIDFIASRIQQRSYSSTSQYDEEEIPSNYEALSTWRNRDRFLSHLLDDEGINEEKALRYFSNEAIGIKRRSIYDRVYSDLLIDLYVPAWFIQNVLDQYIDAYSDAPKLFKLASNPADRRSMLEGYCSDPNKDYFRYLSSKVLDPYRNESDWYENISGLLEAEAKDQKNIEWLLENTNFSRTIIKTKFPQPDDRIKACRHIIKRDQYRIARLIEHMSPMPDGSYYTKLMITTQFPTILSREEELRRLRKLDIEYIQGIIDFFKDPSFSRSVVIEKFRSFFERQNEFYRLKQIIDISSPYMAFNELLSQISGYQSVLNSMRVEYKVVPSDDIERKAMDQAFWKEIADFIASTEAINPQASSAERKYFNVVKFLREKQVDDLIFKNDHVEDDEWGEIEEDLTDFAEGFDIEESSNWISTWFTRLMECKQSGTPKGKNFIRNRVKNIVAFLKTIDQEKAKLIIEKDIIDNAQNCSDRALSGLDNAEVMIKIVQARTIPETLGAIIQKFKKNVLEMILDRWKNEVVEEYLYLALLFNEYFALGLPTTKMAYAHFGNHKTFDEALRKFLQHIHYEGIINMIMSEAVWLKAVRGLVSINENTGQTPEEQRDRSLEFLEEQGHLSIDEYNQEIEKIDAVYRKAVEDPIREFTKKIFDESFLITGSKYNELNLEEVRFLVNEEYLVQSKKLEKIRDDAKKAVPRKDRDYFIRSFVDYASAERNFKEYEQKYGHLFPKEI